MIVAGYGGRVKYGVWLLGVGFFDSDPRRLAPGTKNR